MVKKIVVSLGGSIINAGSIDDDFLKGFKKVLFKSNNIFYIVCGGGKLARNYIGSAKNLGVKGVELDEIGIKATELNAELVAKILGVKRSKDLDQAVTNSSKIVVTNGLFPGVTTDFDAVVIASLVKADCLINLSNVKGVYDKDPNKYADSKFLKKLSYDKLISLANEFELGSGANFIFDLAASKVAKRTKTKLVFMQGLDNFSKFLQKKAFTGSIIE